MAGRSAIVLSLPALVLAAEPAQAQEWGFSTPRGAVVRLERGPDLNLVGSAALPRETGEKLTAVPLTGRNEPGKLLIRYHDPLAGEDQVFTYTKRKLAEEGYVVWRADDAPDALKELRAPVNVTSEPARGALEAWSGDLKSVMPVDAYAQLLARHREAAAKYANIVEASGEEGPDMDVAVVTDRPSVAAWEVALSSQGKGITSLQTFSGSYEGVLFTARQNDVVAALDSQPELLRDFGGIGSAARDTTTFVPVRSNENTYGFEIPLSNLFDTFAAQGYDLSKIDDGLQRLVGELRQMHIDCAYGDPKNAMFTAACLHHCSSHNISGNFLVQTIFTFMVGEQTANMRRVFVVADSYGASAKAGDSPPGRDRFTYARSREKPVQSSHEVAVASLVGALRSLYPGLRRE